MGTSQSPTGRCADLRPRGCAGERRTPSDDHPARPDRPAPRVAAPAAARPGPGRGALRLAGRRRRQSQGAGFTPGFASVLTCADGSRHFVKAASLKAQRMFADGLPRGGPQARRAARRRSGAAAAVDPRRRRLGGARDRVRRRRAARAARGGPPTSTRCLAMTAEMADVLTPPPAALALDDFADGVRRLAGVLGPAARATRRTCPGSPSTSTRPPRWPPLRGGHGRVDRSCTPTSATTTCCSPPTGGCCCATGTGRSSAPPGWTPCS